MPALLAFVVAGLPAAYSGAGPSTPSAHAAAPSSASASTSGSTSSLGSGSGSGSDATDSNVLSFKEWKAMRVEETRHQLERAQLDMAAERKKGAAPQEPQEFRKSSPGAAGVKGKDSVLRVQKGQNRENRLQQAKLSLEVANELTINDYFVLYLIPSDREAVILEAVKKMTPDEVAELMRAYKKHLEGSRSASRDAAFLGS
jgi:hypothetical protein